MNDKITMKKPEIIEYKPGTEKQYAEDLKYWSNACGELHHFAEYDITEKELPEDLRRAYNVLWTDMGLFLCYLVTYKGKNYVALINEYDADDNEQRNARMDNLYESMQALAAEIAAEPLFENTTLVLGKEMGFNECHELVVLVDPYEMPDTFMAMTAWLWINGDTTKIKTLVYEDNGGHVTAIVYADNVLTNILTGFENNQIMGTDFIVEAKTGFNGADKYNPAEFDGLTMEQVVEQYQTLESNKLNQCNLIAEITATSCITYPGKMGFAGAKLFK